MVHWMKRHPLEEGHVLSGDCNGFMMLCLHGGCALTRFILLQMRDLGKNLSLRITQLPSTLFLKLRDNPQHLLLFLLT